MSSKSLQSFLTANTAHFFGFTAYTHLHVTNLRRLNGVGDLIIMCPLGFARLLCIFRAFKKISFFKE
jgi:hypothetical protein